MDSKMLRDLLDYDADTGEFRWRTRPDGVVTRGAKAGSVTTRGYIQISIHRRRYMAHRLAWLYVHNEWPPDQIDHINCNKTDNRIANLRPATRKQNAGNRPLHSNNTSGVKGVSWHAPLGKWRACLKINGKGKFLGYYDDKGDAAAAYRAAALKHFGEFASR